MPYNPMPVSKGGNRGIDDTFSRKAPKDKYQVVCVDTFDGTDWVVGDYKSIYYAMKIADKNTRDMIRTYIYDDNGDCIYCGTVL